MGSSDTRMPVAKPPTRTVPAGSASGSRSSRAAVDGGQDRDGVVGQASAGRRQPHPPALGLDQLRAGLLGQRGDLLRHRRRREVVRLGDRAHRAQPGQRQQQLQAAGVHRVNCS